MSPSLDPRLNAFRPDLADRCLADQVTAERFVDGWPAEIIIGSVPVRGEPDPSTSILTFFHHGERLQVFETGARYSWCQSQIDGYVGYVVNEAIAPDEEEGETRFVNTMGSYVYGHADLRTPPADYFPRGARVRVVESGFMTRNISYAKIQRGKYIPLQCLSRERPQSADIVEAAEGYLGAPYLWGGKSARGVDCSALIQLAFAEIDVGVMRDADMQLDTIGIQIFPHDAAELRRGDLIYTPPPNVHVGICDGNGSIIHADGLTMMTRWQTIDDFMHVRGHSLAECIVRRYEA